MLLQIEVKLKMLGRSVTFEPRSVEKRFQQQNFFELTTPTTQGMLKMASLLAVQSLFSTPKNFFVDPPSMAYGKFIYDKKTGVGCFILELFAKNEKSVKNLHFFTDFFNLKIANNSGLVIDRGNPNAPLETFIQAL